MIPTIRVFKFYVEHICVEKRLIITSPNNNTITIDLNQLDLGEPDDVRGIYKGRVCRRVFFKLAYARMYAMRYSRPPLARYYIKLSKNDAKELFAVYKAQKALE